MKSLLPIFLVAAVMAALPSCQKDIATETIVETDTVTINLSRGLIAYYPFTGNSNDSSGNNKHGNPLNG
ncbi:MAG: hypothetical protein EOO92_24795 [Pedobacter sp.]|nr:MAG: hypothetical protein EOO92_24795 [Pedobacter sp.]